MNIQAINIPTKLRIKELVTSIKYKKLYQSNYEVIFELEPRRYLFLYSFGVCVYVNLTPKIANRVSQKLTRLIPGFNIEALDETYRMKVSSDSEIKINHNYILVPEAKLEYLRLVALVLAESVAIESFEKATEPVLTKAFEYSRALKNLGVYPKNQKQLLKFIGFAVATRQEILNNLYIVDTPDETWNSPILEKMYLKLKDQFDIESRYKSLNMSLTSIQESTEIMVDLLQNKKAHTLEIWIIIIILGELLLSLFKIL